MVNFCALRLFIVNDHLQRRFAEFKLGAHFLPARGKRFSLRPLLGKLLPKLCDGRFLLLDFAMFFKERSPAQRGFI